MTDAIIIGGGVAGLSLAAKLAPHMHITVLEGEDHIAYHTSGRSAAAYVPGHGDGTVLELVDASGAELIERDVLSPRGMMLLAKAGEDAGFEAEKAHGKMTELSLEEALGHVPVLRADVVTRAAYQGLVQDIDTDALLQSYLRDLRSHGGDLKTKSPVSAITREDGAWRVTTKTETFTAPLLINAAGAWADEIAGMAGIAPIGIVPHRRSMARVRAPEGHDVSHWPFMFGVGEHWYAKPDAGALIISPAEQDPTTPHDAWAEDETLATGIARYEEMIAPPVTHMLSNWAGLRSFAPDRLLVLGRDPEVPDFVWCAGQGGYGFETSPAAAGLLADQLLERPIALGDRVAMSFSPARFAK